MVEVGRFLRPKELVIGMFPLLPPALSSTRNSFSSFNSFHCRFLLLFSAIPYLLPFSFFYTLYFVCLFPYLFVVALSDFISSSFPSFSPIPPHTRLCFYVHQSRVLRPFLTPFTSLHNLRIYAFSYFGLSVFGWLIFIYLPFIRTGIFFYF
jgi:hypothetical protein